MCGFSGGDCCPPPDLEFHDRVLRLRGPDGRGTWMVGDAWLFHRRLAVIDPGERSDQPYAGGDGAWQCVYNGMIYNFEQLRQLTPGRTEGDTETVAELLGRDLRSVRQLQGMFAAALIQTAAPHRLQLARDPFGIKPLYTRRIGRGLVFSSQVRCLSGHPPARVSAGGLASFLRFGCVTDGTMFEGVDELPAGEVVEHVLGETTSQNHPVWETDGPGGSEPIESVLRMAMERHFRSDVPVCLLLSGGLDSAVIAAHAAGRPIAGLTLAVGDELDESQRAAATAHRYGLQHHIVAVDAHLARAALALFFDAQDQPSIDGFNTFLACRAVAERGYRVALSGLGADELFGGYATYRRVRLGMLSKHLPRWLAYQLLRRYVSPAAAHKVPRALAARGNATALHRVAREVFSPEEIRHMTGAVVDDSVLPGENSWVDRTGDPVLGGEIVLYMQKMLLRDADAQSMASSVELRVPFLDHEVAKAALSISPRERTSRGKRVLVDALGDPYLREIQRRPKTGFRLPMQTWLAGPLADLRREALTEGSALSGYVDVSLAARLTEGADAWSRTWALVALDQWLRRRREGE
jgi:asparagine synthase (glutamine-hydrolysing)